MALPQGLYFRALNDQVSPTDYEAETGTTANYPRTTAKGITVGWENAPSGTRDRSTSTAEVRTRGIHFGPQSGTADYRIDLPSTGNYNIRVALGDRDNSHAARVRFLDTTTVLFDYTSVGTPTADQFMDATGVTRTSTADWVANNALRSATFSTTIFRARLGGGSTTVDPNWAVAALYVEAAGGGVDTPINPIAASIAITGYAPTITQGANQAVAPGAAALAVTAYAPAVARTANQDVSPGAGVLAVTGYAPTVTQQMASPSLSPATGQITITGYAPTVVQGSPQVQRSGGFEMVSLEPSWKRALRLREEKAEKAQRVELARKERKRAELLEKLAAKEATSGKPDEQIETRITSLLAEWVELSPVLDLTPVKQVPPADAYRAFMDRVAEQIRRLDDEDEESAVEMLLLM